MNNFPDDAMDSKQHPDEQTIQEYLKEPGAPIYDELRLHLAACAHCRRRVELTELLRAQGEWLQTAGVETGAEVDDLIAGRLDKEQANRVRQEIKRDPALLRAALHQASHARAMRGVTSVAPPRRPIRFSPLAWLRGWLDFEAPLWKVAPALLVLMVMAGLLLNQLELSPASDGDLRIVNFSDNPVIRFASHETEPGIGFFSQAADSTRAFDGVAIELLGERRLRLSWPEIDGASDYNLKIQVFRDGEVRVLARQSLSGTVAEIVVDEALTQHRYEWILSGDSGDKRSFQASGGFVISRE